MAYERRRISLYSSVNAAGAESKDGADVVRRNDLSEEAKNHIDCPVSKHFEINIWCKQLKQLIPPLRCAPVG
jgi:hypothetical protein